MPLARVVAHDWKTAATLRPRVEVKAALESLIRSISGKAPGQKVDQCPKGQQHWLAGDVVGEVALH